MEQTNPFILQRKWTRPLQQIPQHGTCNGCKTRHKSVLRSQRLSIQIMKQYFIKEKRKRPTYRTCKFLQAMRIKNRGICLQCLGKTSCQVIVLQFIIYQHYTNNSVKKKASPTTLTQKLKKGCSTKRHLFIFVPHKKASLPQNNPI
jgi:hypothetical protein